VEAVLSGWTDFAVVIGAATAALLGLLFVAVSIRVILGEKDGIYLVVPAQIAVLIGGVVNAWLIFVRLTD
jgi:hypothetical protein